MRKIYLAVATALTVVALTRGADPIPKSDGPPATLVTIEAVQPVTADVGKKCVVTVKTTARKVTWRFPAGVDAVPLTADGKSLGVWALPGSYALTALAPSGDDVVLADVQVTITGSVGPPTPASTLNADVKAAYDRDSTEPLAKALLAKKLAQLWRATASPDYLAEYKPTTTWADVFTDVSTANAKLMGQTDLQGVRLVVAKYLDGRIPTDRKTKLDPKLAAAEFGAVASALEALAK